MITQLQKGYFRKSDFITVAVSLYGVVHLSDQCFDVYVKTERGQLIEFYYEFSHSHLYDIYDYSQWYSYATA